MTKTQAVDIHGRSYHRTIMFVLMLIATLAGSLMQSTLGTALPSLMDKFSIDLNTAQRWPGLYRNWHDRCYVFKRSQSANQ